MEKADGMTLEIPPRPQPRPPDPMPRPEPPPTPQPPPTPDPIPGPKLVKKVSQAWLARGSVGPAPKNEFCESPGSQ
jgi:hypothetical protein